MTTFERGKAQRSVAGGSMAVELRQLRYFVAVAEERHFGRAATRLRIAQSGLSQQIKRLERSIGVQLLVRDRRHVELTRAGEVLLDEARVAIEVAERATEIARNASCGRVGLLKVGAYALGIYPAANELLSEFGSRFAHVEVDFQPGHTRQSFDALVRRAIDVAIVFSPFEVLADVQYHPLGRIEPIVAVPSVHRLAELDRIPRSELLKDTFFIWPRDLNPPLVDHMLASFFGNAEHDRLVEIADVTETLVRVAAGEGVTITNPSVVALQISNVVFRRLEDPVPEFEYGLVWLDDGACPFLESFIALAREMGGVDRYVET